MAAFFAFRTVAREPYNACAVKEQRLPLSQTGLIFNIHTLEVPEGVAEMITMFHVTGAYIYVDPDGNPIGVEDVFSKIDAAKKHYESVGLSAGFANQFIR
ncbi:uncharacterized protein A1O9_00636 [Exophiala aquamarina CBS 119918]|uniref:Uncharacterized protein n=1 Tax=Exophiala aquamarina CBS 119918 TaxID=1182545 RepID=A0A072PTJ2_9EURO|nr:uncharacterized protein A1O9_00636 [Exophiala aquamarina CBS 119918]KEF62663.1 hypothetical protein A1O9_00636 [Exophiala aquamarina CBS 119918]